MDSNFLSTLPLLPQRPEESHKGTYGTVIIVGGCNTMIGAPALAATAALRAGVGLVKIATLVDVLPHCIEIQPSATGIVLEEPVEPILDGWPKTHVIALGPGMGSEPIHERVVRHALRGKNQLVIDADGLNFLSRMPRAECRIDAPAVITPHPGEFRRLAQVFGIQHDPVDPQSRPLAAVELAQAIGAVVLLKGHQTVVTDGQQQYINQTGNPALATAGSGDVLTGLIAGLIAQGSRILEAAILGAYLHGLAADQWSESHGTSGLLAMELAELLPETIKQVRQQA